MKVQIFDHIETAAAQCRKQPLKGEDDVIGAMRPVVYDDLRRVRGNQSVQKLGILLRTDLDLHSALRVSAAVGVYIDPNDLRPVKKLRPHPKRCTIQNPDLDQVQLLIAECSKTCFV